MNGILVSVLMAVVAAPPAKTSEERSTRIYVRTTPPGASVVLDGKELGTSDGLFLVPPGVRKITLEMEGYDPESKAVEVKEGWITRVEVRMERSGGKAGGGKATLSEDKIDEIKWMLARDKEKLNEMQGKYGEQHPMVRMLKARIQNWERILEDPSIEAVLDRIDERAEELLNEIESTVDWSRARKDKEKALRRLEPAAAIVAEFLEAVRVGDSSKAASMLTPAARRQVTQLGYQIAAKKSDSATFAVGEVTHVGDGGATVAATWIDNDRRDEMIWMLRSEEEGWRIAGMRGTVFPDEPPLLLDFENLEGTMKKLHMLRETAEQQQGTIAGWLIEVARKVHLPDADTNAVLDLASGELLEYKEPEKVVTYFTELGKGDLAFDQVLSCLRGGTVRLWKGGLAKPIAVERKIGDIRSYQLPRLPCELLVTTAERRRFVVKVVKETEEGGLDLEYRELEKSEMDSEAGEEATLSANTRKMTQQAKAQLELLGAAVERYREDMGSAQHALSGLTKVPDDPKLNVAHLERWTGPYLKTEDGRLPLDPWGNSFWYSTDADRYGFQIASMGPDGRFSSADDIFFRSPGREVSSSKIPRGGETSTVDEGILEFRVAANEEEAKGFSEDCADLGWYDSVMDSTDHLVTRKQGGRTQVLLWNTPERSMTKGDSKEKRWQVIQVSVIAEPDRPGRVGVVFDKEGGRLLKELTGGNVGRQMAMLVDGRVVSCPMVQAAIGPRVEITGDFSKEELNRLATALQAGLEPRRPVLPNR